MAIAKTNDANRVIFLIDEANPTEDDIAIAEAIDGNVVFRNSRFITDEDKPEVCIGLAASPEVSIPALYKKIKRVDKDLWKNLAAKKFSTEKKD